MPSAALPAIASALAVLGAGGAVLLLHDLGPQSAHMAMHIALMNVAAPLCAILVARSPSRAGHATTLWAAAAVQIVLLWMWHAPPLQRAAMDSHGLQAVMHGTLFLAALAFWSSLLRLAPASRWQAIPALLVTGKLACLLSALLIFAPRLLFEMPAHHGVVSLSDQQLAGLLMITACPLSYIVAGVVFAAQTIGNLGRTAGAAPHRTLPAAR